MIFKIGFFNKSALNGGSGTELILCTGLKFCPGFEIAPAQIAIPAKIVGMHTFYSRICLYTLRGTTSALGTFEGIDLPDIILPVAERASASAPVPTTVNPRVRRTPLLINSLPVDIPYPSSP